MTTKTEMVQRLATAFLEAERELGDAVRLLESARARLREIKAFPDFTNKIDAFLAKHTEKGGAS